MRAQSLALLLSIAASAGVQAQTVYRCGSSYSERPCEGARALDTASPQPTQDEAARAAANTRRDRQLADAMEKDRLRQEKQAPAALIMAPAPAAALSAQASAKPARAEPGGKPTKGKKAKEKSEAKAPASFKATAPAKPAPNPLRR